MYSMHIRTDLMHNAVYTVPITGAGYSGTGGDRPLSSRNHYLLNQMSTKGDMLHCIILYSMYVVHVSIHKEKWNFNFEMINLEWKHTQMPRNTKQYMY